MKSISLLSAPAAALATTGPVVAEDTSCDADQDGERNTANPRHALQRGCDLVSNIIRNGSDTFAGVVRFELGHFSHVNRTGVSNAAKLTQGNAPIP